MLPRSEAINAKKIVLSTIIGKIAPISPPFQWHLIKFKQNVLKKTPGIVHIALCCAYRLSVSRPPPTDVERVLFWDVVLRCLKLQHLPREAVCPQPRPQSKRAGLISSFTLRRRRDDIDRIFVNNLVHSPFDILDHTGS